MKRSLIAAGVAVAAIALLLVIRNLIVPDPLEQLRATGEVDGRTIYEGSLYIGRDGPAKVGFESPRGEARLWIDGVRVVPPGGDVEAESWRLVAREPWRGRPLAEAPRGDRRPYHAGAVGIRFEAPPGARLLWVPPGRRSDPEYIPPSSLSPDPPASASFGGGAGASRLDGLFAIAIAALLAALFVYLARGTLRAVDRRTALAAAAVLVVALALRLWGLGDAGDTWDENTNWSAGRNYVVNWLSLDFAPASWRWNYEHPPVMKYVAGVGALLADGFGPARALSALAMALACALLVPIGRRLFSLRVGVLAGLCAAFTPHLVAHGQIVGHEAVAVLLWTLAVWLALRLHDGLAPADRRKLIIRLAVLGVVVGLAFWARFSSALLGPLVLALVILQAPAGTRRRTAAVAAIALPLAALLVGFLVWPRLWSDPIGHLGAAWDKLSKPHTPEPFLGAITASPTRAYFLIYLFATAPLGLLLAAVAGGVRAAVRRERALAILGLWLAIPLVIALSPVRQDGVRYVLPALLPLALVAAAGIDWLASRAPEAFRARAFAAGAGLLLLYLVIVCVRIRPYYLDYYGEQVGGPAGVAAAGRFEIAWWGEGLTEAVDVIEREAPERAKVHVCIEPYNHLAWLRGDLWEPNASLAAADWVLVYQPSLRGPKASPAAPGCPLPPGLALVHEVSAQGAPLARVYRRASSTASPPPSPPAAPPPAP
jgi:4-amino-4-deoxy-L-arabinose transferase-like glycosyltransferase